MQDGGRHGGRRTVAAVAVTMLVSGAALAGSGQAHAASQRGATTGLRDGQALAAGDISTIAGGVGGPAQATRLDLQDEICGVTSAAGSVYLGGGAVVRAVKAAGLLTTPAGTGSSGPVGDGGLATGASLSGACGVTTDAAGNLLIADSSGQRVRVLAKKTGIFYGQAMTARHIYTVAGDGTIGFSGSGGPATAAELNFPNDVAVDGSGNLVIADSGSDRIQVVAVSTGTFYGQAMTAGDIYDVATQLSFPTGVAVDSHGNLLIADSGDDLIRVVAGSTGRFYQQAMTVGGIYRVAGNGSFGFSGDSGPATAAKLGDPTGVRTDSMGNLLIADWSNNRIRVVAEKTGTFYGQAMTTGDIYTVAGSGTGGFAGDGGPGTSAELNGPNYIAADAAGNLLIADENNDRIRVLAEKTGTFYGQAMTAGDMYTIAGDGTISFTGDGGPATAAQAGATSVAADAAGNALIAGTSYNRIEVAARATGTFYGQAMTAGDIYALAGDGASGFAGDGGPATSAELHSPQGVTTDAAGNLVIADTLNQRIRVVAESTGTFYGKPMTAGHIYTVAGNGTEGFAGNGGPATSAKFWAPIGVAVDHAGNLLIADSLNGRIRVVAASTGTFYGQAMTASDIYTVAGSSGTALGDGGPATSAFLNNPHSVAVDAAGNLVIADTDDSLIRLVAGSTGTLYGQAMTAGDIYTVAGNGHHGYSGKVRPATETGLNFPGDISVDSAGNLVIADSFNQRIRVVAESAGTFYGKPMIPGDIYLVAGNGTAGFAGDGRLATAAELNQPQSAVADSAGNLLIADNGRIREVLAG